MGGLLLQVFGVSLIGFSGYKLYKISKECVVVKAADFKALEERIRKDERSKANVNREN